MVAKYVYISSRKVVFISCGDVADRTAGTRKDLKWRSALSQSSDEVGRPTLSFAIGEVSIVAVVRVSAAAEAAGFEIGVKNMAASADVGDILEVDSCRLF